MPLRAIGQFRWEEEVGFATVVEQERTFIEAWNHLTHANCERQCLTTLKRVVEHVAVRQYAIVVGFDLFAFFNFFTTALLYDEYFQA